MTMWSACVLNVSPQTPPARFSWNSGFKLVAHSSCCSDRYSQWQAEVLERGSSLTPLSCCDSHSQGWRLSGYSLSLRIWKTLRCIFFTHIMVTFIATTGISWSCAPSQSSSRSRHWHSSGTTPSTVDVDERGREAISMKCSYWVTT